MVMQRTIQWAREGIYRFLAAALTDPRYAQTVNYFTTENLNFLQSAAQLLRQEVAGKPTTFGFGEVKEDRLSFQTLWVLYHDLTLEEYTLEYERIFGLMTCRECPPFETEFQPNSEPFFRSQQLADIAGFYHAFGLQPPASRSVRHDALSLELEFMAFLFMKARLAASEAQAEQNEAMCLETARSFFEAHLAWWVPSFTRGLRAKAGEGYLAELAQVLAAFITIERRIFDLPAPEMPMQPKPDAEAGEPLECANCSVGKGI